MLLVFAIAAALCLRVFVWSGMRAEYVSQRDAALIKTQSAAEVLKNVKGDFGVASKRYGGNLDGDEWVIWYDTDWNECAAGGEYCLRAAIEGEDVPYLGKAKIELSMSNGDVLSELSTCWQEEEHG
jgi:hypothetical protein